MLCYAELSQNRARALLCCVVLGQDRGTLCCYMLWYAVFSQDMGHDQSICRMCCVVFAQDKECKVLCCAQEDLLQIMIHGPPCSMNTFAACQVRFDEASVVVLMALREQAISACHPWTKGRCTYGDTSKCPHKGGVSVTMSAAARGLTYNAYRTVLKQCREIEQSFSENSNYHRSYHRYTVHNVVTNHKYERNDT